MIDLSMVEKAVRPSQEILAHTNPLAKAIEGEISARGPIPFDKYMNTWLNGAIDSSGRFIAGYYTGDAAVIGDKDGKVDASHVDFVTPSEYTPLYGFML